MFIHSVEGTGKVLKSGCVDFLNKSLERNPAGAVRLLIAYKRIVEIDKIMQNDERIFSDDKDYIEYMLEPIKDFLTEVKESHWEVRTILVESLKVPFKGNLDIISLTTQEDQDSYILRYLNGKENDIVVFLKKAVRNQQDLKQLCKELKTFIGDLQESFSTEVKKQYVDLIGKMKSSKEEQPKQDILIPKT